MRKKIGILLKTLVLVLLTVLVLRPVVVSVHNGAVLGNVKQDGMSFSRLLSAPHSVFHHIGKEAPPDVMALLPLFTRAKSLSLLDCRFNLVLTSCKPSPKSYLVLRI